MLLKIGGFKQLNLLYVVKEFWEFDGVGTVLLHVFKRRQFL